MNAFTNIVKLSIMNEKAENDMEEEGIYEIGNRQFFC